MEQKKRIAIYGGTFDPVHLGHLEIAKRVVQLFDIDELLFVPARRAPHKLDREVTPPLHRYAMLVLATQDQPRLLVSTFELDAPQRCYTVDTLEHFHSEFGDTAELFFVMGADSWGEITAWRDWQRLTTIAHLVVVTRPGYEIDLDQATLPAAHIVDLRGALSEKVMETLRQRGPSKVLVTDVAQLDISATTIRRAAREESFEQLSKLLPPAVAGHISKYRLYRNSNEA